MRRAVRLGWNHLDFTLGFSLVILECFLLEQTLFLLPVHRQSNPTNVVLGLSVVCVRDKRRGKEGVCIATIGALKPYFLVDFVDLEVVESDVCAHDQGPRSNTPKDPFDT